MSGDPWTPTTEQVRDSYVRKMRDAFVASTGEHMAEFDRWLAARDLVLRRLVWDDAFSAGMDYQSGGEYRANPYLGE